MIAQGCKLFLLTVLGVCLTLLATAQPRLSISGTVADEKNDIVKGATVL
jgi:hypothetical protein